jgi:two-component system, chemotaxis family, protein-glutamate methylesterase/glutaminase
MSRAWETTDYMERVLRVLVVDDSAYVRKVIKQMLSRSPFIDVVGVARDGEEALTLVEELRPDVVTVDLIMPGIAGLGFIREQMARAPLPIVIVSIASETSELVLDALDSGAIDFVQKPSALATEKVFEMADDLIEKVKAAGNMQLGRTRHAPNNGHDTTSSGVRRYSRDHGAVDIVVIGISTGGPQTLKALIPKLPADFPVPIAIVLHMPVGYTDLYAKRLNEMSRLNVSEAQEGDVLRKGRVLLAPAGHHMTLVKKTEGTVVAHLDSRPFDTLHSPSVDVLFRSAAEVFGSRVLGVVMTGMGDDGREGARIIKSNGGLIFAEAEESCVVYGMPRSVVEAGLANRVMPLEQMSGSIAGVAYGEDTHRR